jgi:hypothetical protein
MGVQEGNHLLLSFSTACAFLTLPSTILLIRSHLKAWARPDLQLRVVRIVLMVRPSPQRTAAARDAVS